MKANPSIFRAYDVRGVYGKDLDEEVMEKIGNAFASLYVKEEAVVGMDARNSGPSLREAFIAGVTRSGKKVRDVGLVPRGACLYWAWKLKLPSAYITASHLTPEWNGVKFGYEDGVEFFEDDNYRIRDFVTGGKSEISERAREARKEEINESYRKFILSRIRKCEKPLKVVVDCGNGTGGLAAPALFEGIGCSVNTLFGEPDGSFPNRPSEVDEESLSELRKRVKGADIGVAYDGDSDRMSLMDDKGRLLGPETASSLILQELAKTEKGPIIANVECLKLMDEIARKHGRSLYRIRVGNSFMVREVEKRKACFGVEKSGHFCIPSIIPMDDGIAASLFAASALSRTGKKLSEIVDSLPEYPFERVKVPCGDNIKFRVMENMKKRLSSEFGSVNTIDGVRVDFDYGWVLVRASNTEPAIRISVEAENRGRLSEIREKFSYILEEEKEATISS